jgi:hypothetical protein
MTFEAESLEQARQLAIAWGGVGLEGQAPELNFASVSAPLPEAYDLVTARKLLGNVSRGTIYRWLLRGKLERHPDIRKVLITRRSIEQSCDAKKTFG